MYNLEMKAEEFISVMSESFFVWLFPILEKIDFRIATDEWRNKHFSNLVRLADYLENEISELDFVKIYDTKIGFLSLKELKVERYPET